MLSPPVLPSEINQLILAILFNNGCQLHSSWIMYVLFTRIFKALDKDLECFLHHGCLNCVLRGTN
jgi:hypothetical protein